MDIDILMLKNTVVNRNTTLEALAYEMGIDRSTLYRRLKKGSSGITLKDARTISHCLCLSENEKNVIFGGHYVAYM